MSKARWVCLMYHDVMPRVTGGSGGPGYFAVPREAFVRQLSIIRDMGLRGGSVADVLANPDGRIAISFDDGDAGQAEHAFPALRDAGMTATFFVTTGWVGRPGYVSWNALRDMRDAGMSIQSHTHTHPFLSELNGDTLRDELRRSRDLLDHHLGPSQRTTMIALPGGDLPRRPLRSVFADEGYEVVATSRWGVNRLAPGSPSYVRRCTVRASPDDGTFAATVLGNPWLAARRGMREHVLGAIRRTLGPTRYARWRRDALSLAGSFRAPAAGADAGSRPD